MDIGQNSTRAGISLLLRPCLITLIHQHFVKVRGVDSQCVSHPHLLVLLLIVTVIVIGAAGLGMGQKWHRSVNASCEMANDNYFPAVLLFMSCARQLAFVFV